MMLNTFSCVHWSFVSIFLVKLLFKYFVHIKISVIIYSNAFYFISFPFSSLRSHVSGNLKLSYSSQMLCSFFESLCFILGSFYCHVFTFTNLFFGCFLCCQSSPSRVLLFLDVLVLISRRLFGVFNLFHMSS